MEEENINLPAIIERNAQKLDEMKKLLASMSEVEARTASQLTDHDQTRPDANAGELTG